MKKRRGLTGSNKKGLTEEERGLTEYHPVMKYLIPGKDREKMEAIVESLKRHNQLENVYLGAGRYSLPFDIVGELLEVT